MRIIFIILLAMLLSSCSLFKKTTTSKHTSEVITTIDSSSSTTINERASAVLLVNEKVGALTEIRGDQITITSEGKIQAVGNASAKQTRLEQRNSDYSDYSEKSTQIDSDYSEKAEVVVKDSKKVSVPDWKLYVAIAVGIIGFILLYKIRRKI